MSETAFPVNDLLRRKLQTSLTIISLTLCVGSTLFLLLFSEKMGFSISSIAEGKLTSGFAVIFPQFVLFISILIFVIGAVIMSFMVFAMMSQKVKDIGLMRAAGCPNDLIFGYFITELLIITLTGCFLGVVFGILTDFVSTIFFSNPSFQITQKGVNIWLVLLVFALYFALAMIAGVKVTLDTTRIAPSQAFSPSHYLGLTKESSFKATSKSALTIKIALRSLYRHKSATIRIVVCLSAVFLLATVGIAGGIIANRTVNGWIEGAIGRDIFIIGHEGMCSQYRLLLSRFYEFQEITQFNYSLTTYLIPDEILSRLNSMANISGIDPRLVLKMQVEERPGYILGQSTSESKWVGDNHKGKALIIGVEPEKVLSNCFLDGEFLTENQTLKAVIGDSLAKKMFEIPLIQQIKLFDAEFNITGVCLDPINNGNVTYVPLKDLQNITGLSKPNIIMVKANPLTNRASFLSQLRAEVKSVSVDFEVFDLNEVLDANLSFFGYIWSTIMFLPLFSLFAASLCLITYVVLSISEQRQELGILRALGARPKTVVGLVSIQSIVVLLSGCAVGIAFGIMLTLMILIPEPIITFFTVAEISGWLLTALAVIFALSLYPAITFGRKPITETIMQP